MAARISTLAFILLLAAGCGGIERKPVATENVPAPVWAMEGGDAGRRSNAGAEPVSDWTDDAMHELLEPIIYGPQEYSSPIKVAERFYVGHSKGAFVSFDPFSRKIFWSKQTGGSVFSTPAYGGDKLIVSNDEGLVLAYDLEGEEKWRFRTTYPVISSPLIVEDRVYIISASQEVYSLELSTGEPVWKYEGLKLARAGVWKGNSLAYGDGKVFCGLKEGAVVALDAGTGRLAWKRNLVSEGLFKDVGAGPLYADGKVYAGVFQGDVVRLDGRTGEAEWVARMDVVSGFALAGGKLYGANGDGEAFALRVDDGDVAWKTRLEHGHLSQPVVAGGEVVYLGADRGMVGLDRVSGVVTREYSTGSGAHGQPLIYDTGILIFSDAGVIHAMGD